MLTDHANTPRSEDVAERVIKSIETNGMCIYTPVASLHLYCMYGYTVTVYYTCTVDSRTDPKSGTVSFLFVSTRVHITVDTTACFSL